MAQAAPVFPPRHRGNVKEVTNEMVRRINENSRRIRQIEMSIERVRRSMHSLDENAITQMSDLKLSLEQIAAKISEISDRIGAMETEVARLQLRANKAASKSELKQMENFIDLINPVTSKFVTREEMERALDERVFKIKKKV